MKRIAQTLGLFFAVLLGAAQADAGTLQQSNQVWTSATLQGNLGSRFAVMLDLHARFNWDFSPYWMLVRPAVGVRLIPNMYVFLGYGWTPTWSTSQVFIDEHRAWQQWNWDVPGLPMGMKLFVRSRLEERFRPETSDEVGFRFRQMARLLVPFDRAWPVYISVWDELFLAFNTTNNRGGNTPWQRAGFDQNRFFIGPSVQVHRTTRLELGYLQQVILQGDNVVLHHIIALNAAITLP